MSELPEFKSFSKIPRLNRDVTITEKIDGTNALVYVGEDGTVAAGQRTMWVRWPNGPDNYGFGAWVKEHEEELRKLGPGYHYGEWYGLGIQRGYGLKEKRFMLFRVPKDGVLPACVELSTTLYHGPFSTEVVNGVVDRLRRDGSSHVPNFMDPEGVVIFHEASGQRFKVTCQGDEKPKGLS